MATGWLWDERYMWHDTGYGAGPLSAGGPIEPGLAHAEAPETKRRFRNLVDASGLLDRLVPLRPRPATDAELRRLHAPEYVARVRELSGGRGGLAGEITPFGAGSFEVAALAVGGAIVTVDAVLDGTVENAYALIRPPGHHAEAARGRGYCIFANGPLAVLHARAARGVGRVAVIDWDVHHGNGAETAFYDDPDVLTVSVHGEAHYPADRGAREDTGRGPGQGANLNVPLPHGSGMGAYLATFERVIAPAIRAFRPELLVVACGYDASALDPAGRQLLHSDAFRRLTELTLDVAAEVCEGRVAMLHEGGYSAAYVPFCGLAVVEALSGVRTEVVDPFLDEYAAWPAQQLQPHQDQAIAAAERLVAGVPRAAAGRRGPR